MDTVQLLAIPSKHVLQNAANVMLLLSVHILIKKMVNGSQDVN